MANSTRLTCRRFARSAAARARRLTHTRRVAAVDFESAREKGKNARKNDLVGVAGFEPATPASPNVNSNQKVQQKQCSLLAIDQGRLCEGFKVGNANA